MILRKYFFLVGICLALGSCADKLICPAYQSSFIHDKETLRKRFSYFHNDSTPKVLTASKTKYLIAVPESYRKRYRKMQTVNMQEVHPVVPDSILNPEELTPPRLDSLSAPLDSLGQVKADSTNATASADSVYMITKDKEVRILRYNYPDSLHYDPASGRYVKESPYYYVDEVRYTTEQENYMWFFRKELILPDVRLSKSNAATKSQAGGAVQKKKGFFRKLMFWKKDKTDSTAVSPQPLNNLDTRDSLSMWYDSSAQVAPNSTTPAKTKKKGFLGIFKKKETDPASTPPKQPAKKDDDDQGF
jgi:hypothetical protein